MITVGRKYRYTARRGKLTRKHGQIVTVLVAHRNQILVRFPDGSQRHIHKRFLQELNHAN